MSFVVFGVARAVCVFFFRKHRKHTKLVLMHSSTALMTVDCLKAIGFIVFGGELMGHIAHVCGASGALIGAFACYLED